MGIISPFGDGIGPFWDAVSTGKNGVGKVTLFDASNLNCQVAAECREFDATKYMDPKEAKRSDRYTHFAVAASKLAMVDAGLEVGKNLESERFGVLIGSGVGGMDTIETQSRAFVERGPRRVSPFMIPNLLANMSSGVVAIALGAKGVNFSVVSACATGTHAIGEAMLHLQAGREDVILAGGSEAAITPLGFAGFTAMKAMATEFNDQPERASRPFDADRCGFVMGEGAGVIVLERYDHAVARGAKIVAEIAGWCINSDAGDTVLPDASRQAECMRRALARAGMRPQDVDIVSTHATGTGKGDEQEMTAMRAVFSDCPNTKINNAKGFIGHCMGAAGTLELAGNLGSFDDLTVHPCINIDELDPACAMPGLVIGKPEKTEKVDVILNNSFGMLGINSTLIVKRFVP